MKTQLPQSPFELCGLTWQVESPHTKQVHITSIIFTTEIDNIKFAVTTQKFTHDHTKLVFVGRILINGNNNYTYTSFIHHLTAKNINDACSELVTIWRNQVKTWAKTFLEQ